MTSLRPVLLVDSDSGKLEKLISDRGTGQVPMICAVTPKEARLRLVDLGLSFSGIFINPSIEAPRGLGVIRLALERQIGTPIYLIEGEENHGFDDEELKGLAIQGVLKKPLSYREICRLVAPTMMGFDADGALSANDGDEIRLDPPGSIHEEYSPILARNFLSGQKAFFDLHVRLTSGRYMKILKAGDDFDPSRLETYLKKGVTRFYLRREVQARYLSYCDQLAEAVLASPKISVGLKLGTALNLGQETMSFLRANGVVSAHLEYAHHFIGALADYLRESSIDGSREIRRFMANLPAYDHGVSTVLVGAVLGRALGLSSPRSQRLVGLACLFHDIGLENAQEMEVRASLGTLSPEEQAVFDEHASEGAQVLRQVHGIEDVVAEAVAQHHEGMNGSGLVAEVVGIADEFVNAINRAQENREFDPLSWMATEVLPKFSNVASEAFVAVFLRPPR